MPASAVRAASRVLRTQQEAYICVDLAHRGAAGPQPPSQSM